MTASATSAEHLLAVITWSELTLVVDDPTNDALVLMTDKLCANTYAVNCLLGDGTIGYIFIILSPEVVVTICGVDCRPSRKPSADFLAGGDKSTTMKIDTLHYSWEESKATFQEYFTSSTVHPPKDTAVHTVLQFTHHRPPSAPFWRLH